MRTSHTEGEALPTSPDSAFPPGRRRILRETQSLAGRRFRYRSNVPRVNVNRRDNRCDGTVTARSCSSSSL